MQVVHKGAVPILCGPKTLFWYKYPSVNQFNTVYCVYGLVHILHWTYHRSNNAPFQCILLHTIIVALGWFKNTECCGGRWQMYQITAYLVQLQFM